MVQHMTLMMLVPILLRARCADHPRAARAPHAAPTAASGRASGCSPSLHSRFMRVVSNPIVAAVLFVGSLVGFYYTDLFQLSLRRTPATC